MGYKFYYDESEHSRKINYKTITADNYYDNFIAVIVGWCSDYEENISKKYAKFEEKYENRKSHGELKSSTIKQSQLRYGFASLNGDNIDLLDDFLSIFGKEIFLYYSVISKIEFVIVQLFEKYQNSPLFDMDSLKYSIIKAILVYKPQEVIECIYNNTENLIDVLKNFFHARIEKNKTNVMLKQIENEAFEQILFLLDDVNPINTTNWNYDIAFVGFRKYLENNAIEKYALIIDKEGENQNTANAARRVGLSPVGEKDSLDSFGIRIADMLAGLISKLLKAMCSSLHSDSLEEPVRKNLLETQWFAVNDRQLELYKKLYNVIFTLNNDWYKSFSSIYSDDLIAFLALLEYMSHFENASEITKSNINMQGEYFNAFACERLGNYFKMMKNKLPVEFIRNDSKDYFLNQRGAVVYFDVDRQPSITFTNGKSEHNVLSVGFSKEGIPLVTVEENGCAKCYRLPEALAEWAFTSVGMANMGINLFPAEVQFSELNGKYYADIL